MENENEYAIVDQYGNYRRADIISARRYDPRPERYVSWDIETERPVTSIEIELERFIRQLGTTAAIDLQSYIERAGYSEYNQVKVKPDCILDDILTKQKRGLKPYYQEKLEYKIDDSNDGVYIEYEPGTDLAPTQKIEWLSPKLIEKLNSCYESKKQAYFDKKEADEKYLTTLVEIDQAIENYKTKGHNFIL
jgi:hypothetical protein